MRLAGALLCNSRSLYRTLPTGMCGWLILDSGKPANQSKMKLTRLCKLRSNSVVLPPRLQVHTPIFLRQKTFL